MAQRKPKRKKYTQAIVLKDKNGKPTNKIKTIIHTAPHSKNKQ